MFDKLKNQDKMILFSSSLYALLFIIFYPSFYTTFDENRYLRVAYLIRTGSIVIYDSLYSFGFVFNNHAYVPVYPIGQSLLLLPFTLFTWEAAFLSGLFFHLLGFIVFYKLLIRLGERGYNALLFLFFPYFVYYSTTLFSGFSSSFFILLAFYFYISTESKKHFLSGVFFGIACLIRYTNLLVFLSFASISLVRNRQRLKYLALGFAPLALFILFYNHAYYGGIFTTGYALQGKQFGWVLSSRFSLRNYLTYVPFIIYRLLIVYPLMFFAPFFYKKSGRAEILLTVLTFFLLYGARSQSGSGYGLMPSTLTRYFIPIVPLYLITYIPFYEKLLEKINLPHKPTFVLITVILFLGSTSIFVVQHEYLSRHYSVSNEIYSNTDDHSLIVGHGSIRKYLMEPFGNRRFLSIEEDISGFFDDNMYIVYKGEDERTNTVTEKRIRDYSSQLELVHRSYHESAYGMSEPFKLEIYRVKK